MQPSVETNDKIDLKAMALFGNSNPIHLYHCCVCGTCSVDRLEELFEHVKIDRKKMRAERMPVKVAGYYECKYCTFKTKFYWIFQQHLQTRKHQRNWLVANHVKEGGTINEWKLDYLSALIDNQMRCNVCDYSTGDVSELKSHVTARLHKYRASLFHHLSSQSPKDADNTERLYRCLLCGFSSSDRATLFQHVGTPRHAYNEINQLTKHQKEGYAVKDFFKEFFTVNVIVDEADVNITLDNGNDNRVLDNADVKKIPNDADNDEILDSADDNEIHDDVDDIETIDDADDNKTLDNSDVNKVLDDANVNRILDNTESKSLKQSQPTKKRVAGRKIMIFLIFVQIFFTLILIDLVLST